MTVSRRTPFDKPGFCVTGVASPGHASPVRIAQAAAVSLALCCTSLGAARAAAWTLENDQLAVSISTRCGGIQSVLRKGSGQRYRNPAEVADALWLRVPVGAWDGHGLAGCASERIRKLRSTGDSIALQLKSFETSEGDFPIEAVIRYRLEGDNVVASLTLVNRGESAIDEVAFPGLRTEPAATADETLYLASGPVPLQALFSPNRVRHHHDPFQRLDPTDYRGWFHADPNVPAKAFGYPGFSSMHTAWISYHADGGYLGWDVRDRKAQTQHFVIDRNLERDTHDVSANRWNYRMSWHWHPRIKPGGSWESPEVYLKFGSGDWHGIARQHREWLDTWVKKPDPPDAFKASLGWISHGITSFEEIPELARRGVEVGAPYFIVYGWFGYGMQHLSYDYYPRAMLGGETSLRANLLQARELGAYPLAWFNPTTTVASTREHLRYGKDWVIVDRWGGVQVDGRWSLFGPDRPQITDDATIDLNFDMGTPVSRFIVSEVRRLIEDYGFSGFEFDQAGKNYVSYSPHSDHAPELGYSEGMRAIYTGAMEIVRAGDPNGVILGEGISDFMNQYVDSSWLFEGGEDFPGGDRADWVAKATFTRYSLPWVTFPARAEPDDPGHANAAFLLNAPLDIFADALFAGSGAEPEFARHLRRLHGLKQRTYPFLYGGTFSDTEGFELKTSNDTMVLAKSYLEPCRSTVVVINRGEQPEQAELIFPAAPESATLTHFRLDAGETRAEAGTLRLHLRLRAFDVSVVVLDRCGEGA
jgi:hypothetical protein